MDEYEATVRALNAGDKLPSKSGPPDPALVIGFAMLGMWALTMAALTWESFNVVAPLVGVSYFYVLTKWARSGRD